MLKAGNMLEGDLGEVVSIIWLTLTKREILLYISYSGI